LRRLLINWDITEGNSHFLLRAVASFVKFYLENQLPNTDTYVWCNFVLQTSMNGWFKGWLNSERDRCGVLTLYTVLRMRIIERCLRLIA
jgi:hypothetical protein